MSHKTEKGLSDQPRYLEFSISGIWERSCFVEKFQYALGKNRGGKDGRKRNKIRDRRKIHNNNKL